MRIAILSLVVLALAAPAVAQSGVRAKAPGFSRGGVAQKLGSPGFVGRGSFNGGVRSRSSGASFRTPIRTSIGGTVVRSSGFDGFGRRGFTVGGSGLRLDADFGDVDARLSFGAGLLVGSRLTRNRFIVFPRLVGFGFGSSFGYCGSGHFGDGFHERRPVVQGPTVIVIDRTGVTTNQLPPNDVVTPQAEPEPIPDRELGTLALRAGEWAIAADALARHVLVEDGDHAARRLLAVALVLDGQVELGVAVLAAAYRGDPGLAARPLGRELVGSLSTWRRAQRSVQRWAMSKRTASGWLAAIAFTQAELGARTQLDRLERARRLGLDVDVADGIEQYYEGLRGSAPSGRPVSEVVAAAVGASGGD
ncbi:MAG: hypothetical protein AAFX79_10760 [Planctomycetota bacterium]